MIFRKPVTPLLSGVGADFLDLNVLAVFRNSSSFTSFDFIPQYFPHSIKKIAFSRVPVHICRRFPNHRGPSWIASIILSDFYVSFEPAKGPP